MSSPPITGCPVNVRVSPAQQRRARTMRTLVLGITSN
jgi:hypothetical protein